MSTRSGVVFPGLLQLEKRPGKILRFTFPEREVRQTLQQGNSILRAEFPSRARDRGALLLFRRFRPEDDGRTAAGRLLWLLMPILFTMSSQMA